MINNIFYAKEACVCVHTNVDKSDIHEQCQCQWNSDSYCYYCGCWNHKMDKLFLDPKFILMNADLHQIILQRSNTFEPPSIKTRLRNDNNYVRKWKSIYNKELNITTSDFNKLFKWTSFVCVFVHGNRYRFVYYARIIQKYHLTILRR